MTFLGVPIFDWVLLVVVLGFGIEAWITCRDKGEDSKPGSASDEAQAPSGPPAETVTTGLPPKEP
jgi:hypothetical protein